MKSLREAQSEEILNSIYKNNNILKGKFINLSKTCEITENRISLNRKQFEVITRNNTKILISKKDNSELLKKMEKLSDEDNMMMFQESEYLTMEKTRFINKKLQEYKKLLSLEECDVELKIVCSNCKNKIENTDINMVGNPGRKRSLL